MNGYYSLKSKKVLDNEGKNIGKIIQIVNFTLSDEKEEIYALVQIPRLFRRPMVFPLPLLSHNPIVTKKGDFVIINKRRIDFLSIIDDYSKKKKSKQGQSPHRISVDDASLALQIWEKVQ